jgi:hypothetical protein
MSLIYTPHVILTSPSQNKTLIFINMCYVTPSLAIFHAHCGETI